MNAHSNHTSKSNIMSDLIKAMSRIRNMSEELSKIKLVSQNNTTEIIEDLRKFHNRTAPASQKKPKSRFNTETGYLTNTSLTEEFQQPKSLTDEMTQMSGIRKRIEKERSKSKKLLEELENSSNLAVRNIHERENETETKVTFTNRRFRPSPKQSSMASSVRMDALTRKLKDIQDQNDELRAVNENIQNLLLQLNDLRNVDKEEFYGFEILGNNKSENQNLCEGNECLGCKMLDKNFGKHWKVAKETPRTLNDKAKDIEELIKLIGRLKDVPNEEHRIDVNNFQTNVKLKAHPNKVSQR